MLTKLIVPYRAKLSAGLRAKRPWYGRHQEIPQGSHGEIIKKAPTRALRVAANRFDIELGEPTQKYSQDFQGLKLDIF